MMSSSTNALVRRKGLLAFLEDSATLFPYDADACKKKVTLPTRTQRGGGRRRRRRGCPPTLPQRHGDNGAASQENEGVRVETTLTETLMVQKPRVILFFFCDPEQCYSITVRNWILQVLYSGSNPSANYGASLDRSGESSGGVLCLVVSLGEARQVSPFLCDFLSATGILVTRVASTMALHNIFLPRVQGYPHLMLVKASNGQAFGGKHEELALEWNSANTVRQRWLEGTSGLDCVQQTWAGLLFPTACAIL